MDGPFTQGNFFPCKWSLSIGLKQCLLELLSDISVLCVLKGHIAIDSSIHEVLGDLRALVLKKLPNLIK